MIMAVKQVVGWLQKLNITQQQQQPFNGCLSGTTRVGHLQILHRVPTNPAIPISRIHFKTIPEDLYATSHTITPEITVILFARVLPHVQCTKNCPTCRDYIANYKIFRKQKLNSSRFPVFTGTKFQISDFQYFQQQFQISSISKSKFEFQEIYRISGAISNSRSCRHPAIFILI